MGTTTTIHPDCAYVDGPECPPPPTTVPPSTTTSVPTTTTTIEITGGGDLPVTGGDVLGLSLMGAGAIVVGALLTRRRR